MKMAEQAGQRLFLFAIVRMLLCEFATVTRRNFVCSDGGHVVLRVTLGGLSVSSFYLITKDAIE